MTCPCGSGRTLDECCGPYLSGEAVPPTAEALMRSRYTAFTQCAVDYILDTHDPETRAEIDRSDTEQWARESTWKGLHIRETTAGGPDDDDGAVEFVVTYEQNGKPLMHHEISTFRRVRGRWFFVDGVVPTAKTVLRDQPKIGRNDPCPCGSGRKYKKCCG